MFRERDLVRLVVRLHPYTQPPAPPPSTMIFALPPTPPVIANYNAQVVAAAAMANPAADLDATVASDFTVFNFETQDNPGYEMDWRWMFKGQERIIRRALRFEYKYPVYGGGGALATDYVLVGYEGGGGP
jgi:hypothetical protein